MSRRSTVVIILLLASLMSLAQVRDVKHFTWEIDHLITDLQTDSISKEQIDSLMSKKMKLENALSSISWPGSWFYGKKKRRKVQLVSKRVVALKRSVDKFKDYNEAPSGDILRYLYESSKLDTINALINNCTCAFDLDPFDASIDVLRNRLSPRFLDRSGLKNLDKPGYPTNKQGVFLVAELTRMHDKHLAEYCKCSFENLFEVNENMIKQDQNVKHLFKYLHNEIRDAHRMNIQRQIDTSLDHLKEALLSVKKKRKQ